jgi:hypothetical protein
MRVIDGGAGKVVHLGTSVKRCLEDALEEVDRLEDVVVVALHKDGTIEYLHSGMNNAELAFAARSLGHMVDHDMFAKQR